MSIGEEASNDVGQAIKMLSISILLCSINQHATAAIINIFIFFYDVPLHHMF
jgi:hypothetical protein